MLKSIVHPINFADLTATVRYMYKRCDLCKWAAKNAEKHWSPNAFADLTATVKYMYKRCDLLQMGNKECWKALITQCLCWFNSYG